MKICFVLDENLYRPAGVQYYILGLADRLVADGHQVTVLHSANRAVEEHPINPGIRVHEIAKGFDVPYFSPNGGVSVFPGIASGKKLNAILDNNKFDVFHFNYPFSPFVSGAVLQKLKKLEPGTSNPSKKVGTFHVYVEESKLKIFANKMLGYLNRPHTNLIDNFINTGQPTEHYGRKYVSRESNYVPIGLQNNTKQQPDKSGSIKILFLGRLQKRKGILDFLDTLKILKDRGLLNNARITVAGDGPVRDKAEQKAGQYGLQVDFLGTVHKQKNKLYRQADIAVFPTKYGETFGIVLLEAMNNHAVATGFANAGYRSTMGELGKDYLVESGDTIALADLLEKLLRMDRETLRRHKVRQKEFFNRHFDIENTYQSILDVYRSDYRSNIIESNDRAALKTFITDTKNRLAELVVGIETKR